ncbi:response regulator [Patescibacteria group bacterium]|nr:response regulator [Patescibacteria group bacterium]MBU0963728.1 response regulator [Patescibacteria group bacterium]
MGNNQKKLLLIIDDEEPICKAIADRLALEGFEVIKAFDGNTGLQIARDRHPSLIILDILMPKKHGIEMLRELRKDKWGEKVPVIIITNLPEGPEKRQAEDEGVREFIVKSDIKLEDLVKKVKQNLSL